MGCRFTAKRHTADALMVPNGDLCFFYGKKRLGRKRWLGGPWSPRDAVTLLNSAVDSLTKQTENSRARRFSSEVQNLIELITGLDLPRVESSQSNMSVDTDQDFFDEPEIVGNGQTVSQATMRKVVDMAERLNGQPERSHQSITKLYPWFGSHLLARFKKHLEGGNQRDKYKAIDKAILEKFTLARENKQPVHGRMIQRWGRQCAVGIGLTNFTAVKHWLDNFKKRNKIVSRKVTVLNSD